MDDPIVSIDTPNDTPPQGETAEERLSRLEETNKKLYERTKKAEAEAKALREKPAISEAPKSDVRPSDILKADEFRLYRQGYNEDEIDLIMHNGGAKILENEKSPLVLGLKASREQRIAEEAADKTSSSSGLSDIERKYSEQDFRNMKKEDLEKMLPHVQK